ncbi:MAG: hypothetical protein HQK87_04095 [Nitrospinae bacterium]|nr:hypothetical protein [Nitrospinota bacterium]
MDKFILDAPGAPAAIGAYSQGVVANGFVFTAGQLGIVPETGKLVSEDVGAQAGQVLKNLGAILAAADSTFDDVVRATIYLVDLADFAVVNEIYANVIGPRPPARVTIQVAGLPLGAKVEIEMIAVAGGEERIK